MHKIIDCIKCGGLGYINAYSHIDGGRCFSCAGTGKKEVKVKSESQLKNEALKREQKKSYHANIAAENNRKLGAAIEIYKNHPMIQSMLRDYPMARIDIMAMQLAQQDKIWNTL